MSTLETNVEFEQSHLSSVGMTERQEDVPASYENEIVDSWDQELFDLVAANVGVTIKSPWHQGAEMTLRTAILSAPEINEGNVHMFVAEVMQALAEAATETEEDSKEEVLEEKEPTESEKVDEKSDNKPKIPQVQVNSSKTDSDVQSKNDVITKQPISGVEQASDTKNSSLITAKARMVANSTRDESKHSAQSSYKAEAAASSSNGSLETPRGDSIGATRESAVTTSKSGNSLAQGSAINESSHGFTSVEPEVRVQLNETKLVGKSEVKAKQQILNSEIPEVKVVTNLLTEAKPVQDVPLGLDKESKSITLPGATEATIKHEFTELSNETAEEIEGRLMIGTLDYQLDTVGITDFIEGEEIWLAYFEEPDELGGLALEATEESLEVGEASTSELVNESNPLEQNENTSPEQPFQISVAIEEVEDTLMQLAEVINNNGAEEIEQMNEILDKIIEVSARLETNNDEEITTEAEVQEELEELFTELLDKAYIDYTPELVESLAHLTLMAEEVENLNNEEGIDETLPVSATHEIINKILIALSTIKKAMSHAGTIGKSALQLYIQLYQLGFGLGQGGHASHNGVA